MPGAAKRPACRCKVLVLPVAAEGLNVWPMPAPGWVTVRPSSDRLTLPVKPPLRAMFTVTATESLGEPLGLSRTSVSDSDSWKRRTRRFSTALLTRPPPAGWTMRLYLAAGTLLATVPVRVLEGPEPFSTAGRKVPPMPALGDLSDRPMGAVKPGLRSMVTLAVGLIPDTTTR